MKRIMQMLLVLVALGGVARGADGWTTDWAAAKARSAAEGKPVLMYMTGSDWCTWCMKKEKEVISNKEFMEFAAAHFILMEVDFPKKKEQAAELKAQNAQLKKEYLNDGYPTIWVLDAQGKKLSEDLGTLGGGAAAHIAKLKEILAGIQKK